jgi:hypothetical protein
MEQRCEELVKKDWIFPSLVEPRPANCTRRYTQMSVERSYFRCCLYSHWMIQLWRWRRCGLSSAGRAGSVAEIVDRRNLTVGASWCCRLRCQPFWALCETQKRETKPNPVCLLASPLLSE